jgi:hypothetical protein
MQEYQLEVNPEQFIFHWPCKIAVQNQKGQLFNSSSRVFLSPRQPIFFWGIFPRPKLRAERRPGNKYSYHS